VRSLLLVALLLLPALARADVDPRFARLRDTAEPLGGLGAFLDSYIGECRGFFAGASCRANAEAFRKKYEGKPLYMIIREEAATMLAPGPYQPGAGNYTIHVTPHFQGGGYVLTGGIPGQQDAEGNPVLPLIRISGTTPPGWNAQEFMKLFSNRQLRAQVVFTPQGIWSLPGKEGRRRYGVDARLDAILLTDARTGKQMGLWLAEPGRIEEKKGKPKP
jgi:hypothetical protein